jgi:acyl-coenzyme A thioesterase PaaI-like protein
MDATARARVLLEPIPANRTFGITVVRAADGAAEVALVTPHDLTNVIGSLHSSGLIALADAAGLAAIVAAGPAADHQGEILPLGKTATMKFLAPARGRLLASCVLDEQTRRAVSQLLSGRESRIQVATVADISDETGTLVCQGTFEWSLRRISPAPA